jgi:CHAT domain-containing protein
MAGAKNLIMSLWKVPDEETGIFMTDFYNRLSEGKEISIAFRETQAMMQKKYDPYYWAAFVLVE